MWKKIFNIEEVNVAYVFDRCSSIEIKNLVYDNYMKLLWLEPCWFNLVSNIFQVINWMLIILIAYWLSNISKNFETYEPQKMTFEIIIVYIASNPTKSPAGKWYWWSVECLVYTFIYFYNFYFPTCSCLLAQLGPWVVFPWQ